MKILSKIKMPKSVLIVTAFIILLIGVMIAVKLFSKDKEDITEYHYNAIEQQLADEVINYLNERVELPENAAARIANIAVENYRIIISSDVDVVSDDHTEAIEKRVREALNDNFSDDNNLSDNDKDGLSAGIAEIVWNTILSQIQTATEVTEISDLESEYYFLAESIQSQIDKLEDRKMKVSIQTNIKNNISDMTPEELLAMIEGMTDEELRELLQSLGLSYDEFYDLLASANKDMDQNLEERLKKLKDELEKELAKEIKAELEKTNNANSNINSTSTSSGKSGTNGRDGSDGRDGKDGKDGQNGIDGKDGAAGKDGQSIFIMYSATSSGENMTKTPNNDSKYMGTYTGTSESSNPSDYTWTRYSDATITYSDGTVYITQ